MTTARRLLCTALPALLCAAGGAEGVGVTARLVASTETVAPGASFDVDVRIEAGEAWNGYDLVVVYDPALLARVALPAAQAEGPLMTAACGERWHHVDADTGRVALSHVLLCPGARVTGPGTLYRFRFTALGPTGTTGIQVETLRFLEAGRELSPVEAHGTTVEVGPTPVRAASWGRLKGLHAPGHSRP